jgi:hypothetical protein
MSTASEAIVERVRKLGFECDQLPTQQLSSVSKALACIPMYMVANVHGWTEDRQFEIRRLGIAGSEATREAHTIGKEERKLRIDKPERKVLGTFLRRTRPADLIIYEFAVQTLADFLAEASAEVAEELRVIVARTTIRVARAAGKGILGTGEKITAYEADCINQIATALQLDESPRAQDHLDALGGE